MAEAPTAPTAAVPTEAAETAAATPTPAPAETPAPAPAAAEEKPKAESVNQSIGSDLTKSTTGKHPLENTWVIWFDSRKLHSQSNDWFANLQTVAIFKTVEDFWRTHTHVKRPTELEFGSNYHFFKQGIKPMWEDEANKSGGKWVIPLDNEKLRVDDVWELLLLAMVGEYLEEADESILCGAVISKRKVGMRISVWTKISHDTPENEALLLALGKELRSTLKLSDKTELEFQDHADAMSSQTSYRNQARLKLGGTKKGKNKGGEAQ